FIYIGLSFHFSENLLNSIKKIVPVFFLVLVYSCGDTNTPYKISDSKYIVDDLGNNFSIEKTYERIVSLAPNLTEMVFELEAGELLVGNTTYCNYPPEADSVSKVGDLLSINYEKIVELNPDLILITVEGNSKNSYEKLKNLGFDVFVSNPRDYQGIKKSFKDIASIFHKDTLAETIIEHWDKKISKIEEAANSTSIKDALFVISVNPIMTAGTSTFVNEYLKFCGIKNAAEESQVNYPVFSREEILLINPSLIVTSVHDNLFLKDVLELYPEWKELYAIKNNAVVYVDADLYFRPGPRFVIALSELSEKLRILN
ncbi:MAG: cobalamin-binding protein, partial [Ignavibacterium sp.]|nr:cobalamin-binding protein [Ignavibacterium sp.]